MISPPGHFCAEVYATARRATSFGSASSESEFEGKCNVKIEGGNQTSYLTVALSPRALPQQCSKCSNEPADCDDLRNPPPPPPSLPPRRRTTTGHR